MALRLHDHLAVDARQRAQRHMIGQRTRRHENRPLLAEQLRKFRFNPFDRATKTVGIGVHRPVRRALE